MTIQVHLVDGTYELFRCFHGAPRARNREGREVGAARGMLATFAALVNEPGVTHVAVAFDSVVPPAGVERLKPGEADLASQVGLAADVTRALGLPVWPSGRFQADELLATAAARFAEDGRVDRVVICTTDLDLAQCIRGERVVLLDRSRKRFTTEADIVTRFGVPPSQLADLFALVGDRSDGIAGVPGWGLRSAAAVLRAYGRVDAIPDDDRAWTVAVRGAARLAASLRERRLETVIARDVLDVRTDVGIHVELGDLEWRGAHRARAAAIAATLDYEEPLGWLQRWADDD
jgi:5'-3' exonuclease